MSEILSRNLFMNDESTFDTKPILVCINGWAAKKSIWDECTDRLMEYFDVRYIDLSDNKYAIDTVFPKSFFYEALDEDINRDTFWDFIADDENVASYIDQLLVRLKEDIPKGSHLMGWSLGGMLATRLTALSSLEFSSLEISSELSAHGSSYSSSTYSAHVASLVTLCSNLSFVVSPQWSQAMDKDIFSQFLSGFASRPEKILKRFLSLQVQGELDTKSAVLSLAKHNAYMSDNIKINKNEIESLRAYALLRVLEVLDNHSMLENINISSHSVFCENDALVPKSAALALQKWTDKIRKNNNLSVDVIKASGHAPQLFHVNVFLEKIIDFYKTVPSLSKALQTNKSEQ